MAPEINRRKQFVTDKRYQGRLALNIIIIGILGMTCALAAFNYLAYRSMENMLWMSHIDASSIGDIIKPHLIYANLAAFGATALAISIYVWLFIKTTRRRILRMSKFIEYAKEGNLGQPLVWLDKDEFRQTALELNSMEAALRDWFSGLKEGEKEIARITEGLRYLKDKPEDFRIKCLELSVAAERLKSALDSLKA